MPLQIYLAESPCSLEQLGDNVNDQLRRDGRCMVVISEGFNVGSLGERRDSFGHVQFSSSETTVAQTVVNYLNKVGLKARGSARGNVPGTDQRHSMAYASTVDLEEEEGGAKVTYQIVGDDEADLKLGLISISSPIARALIGKELGDVADVQAPRGIKSYEIMDVRYV